VNYAVLPADCTIIRFNGLIDAIYQNAYLIGRSNHRTMLQADLAVLPESVIQLECASRRAHWQLNE